MWKRTSEPTQQLSGRPAASLRSVLFAAWESAAYRSRRNTTPRDCWELSSQRPRVRALAVRTCRIRGHFDTLLRKPLMGRTVLTTQQHQLKRELETS